MQIKDTSMCTEGQEQQPFISTQEHPANSWLHLLLYLRIMESMPCLRVTTYSGCYNQHFTSCYKLFIIQHFIKLFCVLRSSVPHMRQLHLLLLIQAVQGFLLECCWNGITEPVLSQKSQSRDKIFSMYFDTEVKHE